MVLPSGCTMCAGSEVMCRVKRGSLRSGGRCNNRRIKWKNDFKIENLGNFRLKILGFLKCRAIKHK